MQKPATRVLCLLLTVGVLLTACSSNQDPQRNPQNTGSGGGATGGGGTTSGSGGGK
ncbi:hypothetical protein [Tumebacillus permanentifrigoris]|uniref:Uncharacterized protein n=1 Tax=Tumebacillus permanentifrigoris TaxID=378543 RepID=A0A316DEJ6_9BACL|nr:hypothetical protein [Tumebacillus permanentifrigoris]PWK14387.1 hypothetical protein C7459_105144 [Tumebacillus permanentifrigoris]